MRFAAVFFNAGFIALPLAQALIHTPASYEGALCAAVYLAVFNIALWMWRLVDMSKKSGCVSRNPGIIGVAKHRGQFYVLFCFRFSFVPVWAFCITILIIVKGRPCVNTQNRPLCYCGFYVNGVTLADGIDFFPNFVSISEKKQSYFLLFRQSYVCGKKKRFLRKEFGLSKKAKGETQR